MPTPFYHLLVAQDLFSAAELLPTSAVRRLLQVEWAAFLFGNTAPDVQVVSGQERAATHFFEIPIPPAAPYPWDALLRAHPELAEPQRLPPAQAAFISGYLCHLLADWMWLKELYWPKFGPIAGWGERKQRSYIHNVLRAYLDRQVLERLTPETRSPLGQAQPQGWLPFTADHFLASWRDFLAPQLQPGAAAATVEVFAARQGLEPAAFYRLLDSQEEMQAQVFVHLPQSQLEDFYRRLLRQSAGLLAGYWSRKLSAQPALQLENFYEHFSIADYSGL